MKRARFRRPIARNRSCPWRLAFPNGIRTTTCAPASLPCLLRWISPPGKSLGNGIGGIAATYFRSFCAPLKRVPAELDVHLIMDNYGTHKTPTVLARFARHPRFHVHFTPASASWRNQVQRWYAALTQKQISRGTHRSTRQLEGAIRQYLETYKNPKPFIRTKTADDILAHH